MRSINDHFKREAKLLVLFPVALIALAILTALLVPPILAQRSLDNCLAAGGAYDAKTDVCTRGPAK